MIGTELLLFDMYLVMNKDIGELSRDIEEEESKTLTNSYNVRKTIIIDFQ